MEGSRIERLAFAFAGAFGTSSITISRSCQLRRFRTCSGNQYFSLFSTEFSYCIFWTEETDRSTPFSRILTWREESHLNHHSSPKTVLVGLPQLPVDSFYLASLLHIDQGLCVQYRLAILICICWRWSSITT